MLWFCLNYDHKYSLIDRANFYSTNEAIIQTDDNLKTIQEVDDEIQSNATNNLSSNIGLKDTAITRMHDRSGISK